MEHSNNRKPSFKDGFPFEEKMLVLEALKPLIDEFESGIGSLHIISLSEDKKLD